MKSDLKVESDDRAFSLDIAAFHIDWEDIQVFGQVNNFGVNLNGGDATSDGLEFTAMARLGDGFSVSLNGAYTDAQLEDDTPPASGGLKGDASAVHAGMEPGPERRLRVVGRCAVDGLRRRRAAVSLGSNRRLRPRLPHRQRSSARGPLV